jgi:hypothetical protein
MNAKEFVFEEIFGMAEMNGNEIKDIYDNLIYRI